MKLAVITDDNYYYNGFKKCNEIKTSSRIDPVMLIDYYEGLTHVVTSTVILIKVKDYKVLLEVINFINCLPDLIIFIEYTDVTFENPASVFKAGKFFLIVKKTPLHQLVQEFKKYVCEGGKPVSIPLENIKTTEWNILTNIIKHGTARDLARFDNIPQKQISIKKQNLSSKLWVYGSNIATKIQIMSLLYTLHKLSILDTYRDMAIPLKIKSHYSRLKNKR